jgi:hypothetical protein
MVAFEDMVRYWWCEEKHYEWEKFINKG